MRLIIDADGCPRGVREVCRELAGQYNVPIAMVSDRSHDLASEADDDMDVTLTTVDTAPDATDYAIAQEAKPTDIIVTGDYGLAALVIDRVTAVLHPDGFIYSPANMDELLYRRYLNQKARRAGHNSRITKRTADDDAAFRQMLLPFLRGIVLAADE